MKLLLSTSNVLGTSSIRRSPAKSNAEFIESLRANFAHHSAESEVEVNGNGNSNGAAHRLGFESWTRRKGDVLEVPALDDSAVGLAEERDQYDITVKLFYLPGAPKEGRDAQAREALDLVLHQLRMPSIDLLIVSFPGIYFDEEEDCPDKLSTRGPIEAEPEPLTSQLEVWRDLEALQKEGLVKKLGIAEFGTERLQQLLEKADLAPSVDQINLRDCCSVPKDLMALAKQRNVELLVHNDCSNVLPRGTVRELLGSGPTGAGILAESAKAGEKRKSLHGEQAVNGDVFSGLQGEVQPLWVIKYTAVVRNRGVVESKGYFAAADLKG